MIQDKVHSVKTEQEKCSVFFALLGQSSPFILQEMGFLKNSTTYEIAHKFTEDNYDDIIRIEDYKSSDPNQ